MEKGVSVLKKLYQMRFKVSKKGTPVLNWSVLFSAACLIFAPHMTIIGAIAALIMGYEFSFDPNGEGFSSEHLEESLRNAAQNVKSTVVTATQAIKTEIDKASAKTEAAKQKAPETLGTPAAAPVAQAPAATAAPVVNPAPAVQMPAAPAAPVVNPAAAVQTPAPTAPVIETVRTTDDIPVISREKVNQDVVQDLEQHSDAFQSNPAATTFHSAYSAMAGSAPTIQFPVDQPAEEPKAGHNSAGV